MIKVSILEENHDCYDNYSQFSICEKLTLLVTGQKNNARIYFLFLCVICHCFLASSLLIQGIASLKNLQQSVRNLKKSNWVCAQPIWKLQPTKAIGMGSGVNFSYRAQIQLLIVGLSTLFYGMLKFRSVRYDCLNGWASILFYSKFQVK